MGVLLISPFPLIPATSIVIIYTFKSYVYTSDTSIQILELTFVERSMMTISCHSNFDFLLDAIKSSSGVCSDLR